jgi:acyl phosphate:glycerol-3-phosphate acyltransferase
MIVEFILTGLIGYLLGSIPTAVWVGKAWHGIDVREHGSKNAGATNTFRVLGKKPGIVVLTIDILKGVLAVLSPFLIAFLSKGSTASSIDHLQIVAAIFAVLGHMFPIFAGFKGGKGVATSLGIIIGIQPIAAAFCIVAFLIVFISFNFVSLGAIVASLIFPVIVVMRHPESTEMHVFSFILAGLVILAHRKNIKRLIKGEESKMNLFKK